MNTSNISFETLDHVARVTINRPDRLNAIDSKTDNELRDAWSRIEQDPSVRCVVLTGSGERSFSAGHDIKEIGKSGLDYWAEERPNGFGDIALRRTLDIPVIARVNGYALGGGFEMVLGCDIVVAASHAQFGLPESRIGRLPLTGGMVQLPRKLPHNLAMGMLLSGRRYTAQELKEFGLVNEVVPADHLDNAVDRWISEILACAPLSVRAIKQTVNRTAHLPPAEAQALKLPALVRALESEDATEGTLAFREKREARWMGR